MIPDVSIKLTSRVLEGVLYLFRQLSLEDSAQMKPETRAMVSILIPLSRKLTNKQHQWQKKNNPDPKKEYKITMDYHEAYALYKCVELGQIKLPAESCEHNDCLIVWMILDKELQ